MKGFLLWFLSCVAGAMRGIETFARHVQEQVREREHQIVYRKFEEAIDAWEKRTGRKVERTFRSLGEEEAGYTGSDWKHFAAFLGSREATKWRSYGISYDEMVKEWQALNVSEPEMTIEGEEEMQNEEQ